MIPFFDKIASTFRWTENPKKSSDRLKAPHPRRLHLEPLEDRTLLAVCYVWDNPNVTGTGGNGTTWNTACKTLEAALEFARDSSRNITEIWVAEGTYTPSKLTSTADQRTATFTLVNGVSIYGGFAGTETSKDTRAKSNGEYVYQTILSGDLGRNDNLANSNTILENAYTVLYGSALTAAVTIEGLTITGGNAQPYYSQLTGWPNEWTNGGGIVLAGCSSITLNNLKITGNSAQIGGGGVYVASGNTTILGCTISGNYAGNSGGGVCLGSGTLTVQSSVIADNSAGSYGGGGLYQANGTLHVSTTHFSGNTGIYGGGLLQDNGTGSITTSSFLSNVAPNRYSNQGQGGGICQFGVMNISTTTFANNIAGLGGGIFFSNNADNQSPKPESNYSNLTISKNIAQSIGGGIYIVSGLLNLNASIVADNAAATSPDIYGERLSGLTPGPKITLVLSGSDNVIGDGTGIPVVPSGSDKITIANNSQGNQVGTASSPLNPKTCAPTRTDSGNSVFVLPLLADSPALGKGTPIGAFSTIITPRPAQTYVVTSLRDEIGVSGQLTFREAFEAANGNIAVGNAPAGSFTETDTIRFADGLTGTIYLNGKSLTIYGGLTISGWTTSLNSNVSSPGAMSFLTIDAGYKSSVIKAIGNINVNISEITLAHGRSSANGGGMVAYSSSITLNKVAIRESLSTGLEGGGGFYSKNTTLDATNIVVADCQATVSGGGMLLDATNATIVGASIYKNRAVNEGGGLFMTSTNGTSLISNATFAQNRASHGAGLAFLETTARLVHLTVTKNVGEYIGGIMVGPLAKVEINNSIVADNFSYMSPDIEVFRNGDDPNNGLLQGSYNLVGNNTGLHGLTTANQNKIGTASAPIDPRFTGPSYYNGQMIYPLASNSPAVDAGSNALSKGKGNADLVYDVRGSAYPRFVSKTGNTVDMGACEFQANLVGSIQAPQGTTIRLGQELDFRGLTTTGTAQKYLWDFNNNGVFGETGAWATQGVELGELVKFLSEGIVPEPGLYPIRLIVEDSSGRRSDTYELGIIILVEAPTYTITGTTSFFTREANRWEIEAENTQNDPIMQWIVYWGDPGNTFEVINGGPRNRISVSNLYTIPGIYAISVTTTSYFGDVRTFKLADLQVLARASADVPEGQFSMSTLFAEELLPPQVVSEPAVPVASPCFWERADLETDLFPLAESVNEIAQLAMYERATDRVLANWASVEDDFLTTGKKGGLFDFHF